MWPGPPWATGKDYFYLHDPDDFHITNVITAPDGGVDDVFYRAPTDTYFSVTHGGGNFLIEYNPDDFSIIHKYPLPEQVNHAASLTIIEADNGDPFFLIGYEFQQTAHTPWAVIQIFTLTDDQLSLIDTVQAPAGYKSAVSITWIADECRLITQGPLWFPPTNFPADEQVGFFVHDDVCNPLPEVLAIVQQLSSCAE